MNKQADFFSQPLAKAVKQWWNPNASKPIMGAGMRDRIKEHGLTMLTDHDNFDEGFKDLHDFRQKSGPTNMAYKAYNKLFGNKVQFTGNGEGLDAPDIRNRVITSPTLDLHNTDKWMMDDMTDKKGPYKIPKENIIDSYNSTGNEGSFTKYDEARALRGTRNVQMLKAMLGNRGVTPDLIQRHLDGHYGNNGWIIKKTDGFDAKNTGDSVYKNLGDIQNFDTFKKNIGSYYVEPKKDLMQAGLFPRVASRIWEKLDPHNGFASGTNLGTKEFRVHAMGGKVIPYGSIERGTPVSTVTSLFNPLNAYYRRAAEAEGQRAIAKMPAHLRNRNFGMDVGFESKTKAPYVVEMNPNNSTGTSGFADDPLLLDSAQAAIRGTVPLHVLARRGMLATGTIGAAGAGAYGLHHHKANQLVQQQDTMGEAPPVPPPAVV